MEQSTATINGHELQRGNLINRRGDISPQELQDGVINDVDNRDEETHSWHSMRVESVDNRKEVIYVKDFQSNINFELEYEQVQKLLSEKLLGIPS